MIGTSLLLYHLPVGSSFEKLAGNWSSSYILADLGEIWTRIAHIYIYLPVFEEVKSKKWRAGSPTVATYIHRLSSPPPPLENNTSRLELYKKKPLIKSRWWNQPGPSRSGRGVACGVALQWGLGMVGMHKRGEGVKKYLSAEGFLALTFPRDDPAGLSGPNPRLRMVPA